MFKNSVMIIILAIVVAGLIAFGTPQQKAYADDFTASNQAEKLVVNGILNPIVSGLTDIPIAMSDGITKRDGLGKLVGVGAIAVNAPYGAGKVAINGILGALNTATFWCHPKKIELDMSNTPTSF